MSAVGCIRGATLISEFLAAIKAAQDVGLAGPRVEQGNGHDPAPSHQQSQQSNVYVTKHDDSNGGCGRNKRSSVHRVRHFECRAARFLTLAVLDVQCDLIPTSDAGDSCGLAEVGRIAIVKSSAPTRFVQRKIPATSDKSRANSVSVCSGRHTYPRSRLLQGIHELQGAVMKKFLLATPAAMALVSPALAGGPGYRS
jgi:hypothetical protein